MRSREGLVEVFSTFLQLDGDRFQTWITDPRLRRSMEQRLGQSKSDAAGLSENYWALYWHKTWQGQTAVESFQAIARGHLTAHIQESCYWVAQKTAATFVTSQTGLADCFQMAIAQIDKILKGFDSQQGFNFKSYASAALNSIIRETLRQKQEIDICTDWGLLRKISQKRLTEALQSAGLATSAIAPHLLAWDSFKLIYIPPQANGTRKLPKPEPETWEAIAQRYNQERLGQSIPTPATAATIEKWLLACAKAARTYLYPNLISINTPKPGQESGEFLDDLADQVQTDSLLSELIAEEEVQTRQTQRQQLQEVLIVALKNLDGEARSLIQFYYAEKLTQQEMASRLNMKQYTVSRRLTKARESLLLTLAQWSQQTLHISPSADLLKYTSSALEEWLETYFAQSPESAS
ncbi:MAG: sigma-70 family RNA polymerase sigma factor [Oculatellaceae cyanobacterium Prado106]|jgi:RNA polymerase sigma factor (sigma-70 family)|nr:sigma-70 family RNA polymerase sigma factor [Oculatellaceae cyanobacterium Prado106]